MKAVIAFIIWVFGVACGLSFASWLLASERIGDAIIMLYISCAFALITCALLIYLLFRYNHNRRHATAKQSY